MAQEISRRPLTAEARARSHVSLWWTKWYWDRFFPEYFGFLLSISFHRCSITWKNEKKKELFILITGLHNKLQGCGASVTSAAGPFTKKKNLSLDEDECSASRPGRFTHGREPRCEWVPEPIWTFWRREKISCPCRCSISGPSSQ
jgi:hypothetical protein